jgi:D-sedoheptulose 7-phosphate isomerase
MTRSQPTAAIDARRVALRTALDAGVSARVEAGDKFFASNARAIAACAAVMADRFFDGGTLLVFGGGAFATDAQHNSVEYVHPVLPGCRALPALSLTNDIATVTGDLQGADPDDVFERQLAVLGRPRDIALAFAGVPAHPSVVRGLVAAHEAGMLTVALSAGSGGGAAVAEHTFHVTSDDHLLAQELHLATYHMLWELVHIVLNHRGIGP